MNLNIDENVKNEETGLDSLVSYNSKNQFLRNLEKNQKNWVINQKNRAKNIKRWFTIFYSRFEFWIKKQSMNRKNHLVFDKPVRFYFPKFWKMNFIPKIDLFSMFLIKTDGEPFLGIVLFLNLWSTRHKAELARRKNENKRLAM
jgi:hypothetical protein